MGVQFGDVAACRVILMLPAPVVFAADGFQRGDGMWNVAPRSY